MKIHFDDDWKNWIRTNVKNGQDKNGLFKILLDENYDFDLIRRELEFEPTIPLDQLVNPLKAAGSQDIDAAREPNPDARIEFEPTANWGKLFIPNAIRINTDKAEVYVVPDFLNKRECRELVSCIQSSLRPSEISREDEPDKQYRTSRTCDLKTLDDPFVNEIDARICSIMGLHSSNSEGIQGQFYEMGQEFKAHTDYFEADELPRFGEKLGQRTFTFMIYLNDVEEGGETSFVALGKSFAPRTGMAVIWNSLHEDGTPNPATMHQALPVKIGQKAIITKWFRTGKNGAPFIKEENEYIAPFTKEGIRREFLPQYLHDDIAEFYALNRNRNDREIVSGGFIENSRNGDSGSVMVELPGDMRNEIHATLKPIMEAWSNVELVPTYVYGIRVYLDGAILKPHRDRLETHIISAIINVAQETNEDWPLLIEDNYYRRHHVVMRPGEMVLYEGARLLHGRPTPFNGTSYANIFCHFRPVKVSGR